MDSLAPMLGEIGGAQLIFLLGLALMCVILLVRSRRYFRQVTDYQVPRGDAPSPAARSAAQSSAASPSAVSPSASAPRQAASAAMPPRDFERWEVAMHDLARDLSGQLDSKIRILELLIREAEKTSARLEAALARSRSAAEPNKSDRPSPAATQAINRAAAPTSVPPKTAAAQPAVPGDASSAATYAKTALSVPNAADKPRFDRIYALADAGLPPATIASQIGSQIGEIELILGIRTPNPQPRTPNPEPPTPNH